MNLDYLVTDKAEPDRLTVEEKDRYIGCVNAYILARVNESYKQAVADVKMPKEMLKKFEAIAQPIVPQARFSIKRHCGLIKLDPNEIAKQFIARFDEETKRVRFHDPQLRDVEIIDNFLAL